MVVIAIFRVIKAPFIDGNLSIIDCYAEAVHVFRNFVHVIKNRLVGAPVHVIEKTVHVHENCCSRVLRILTVQNALLYCSAAGLACVPRATMNVDGLAQALSLPKGAVPIMNVVVGMPK